MIIFYFISCFRALSLFQRNFLFFSQKSYIAIPVNITKSFQGLSSQHLSLIFQVNAANPNANNFVDVFFPLTTKDVQCYIQNVKQQSFLGTCQFLYSQQSNLGTMNFSQKLDLQKLTEHTLNQTIWLVVDNTRFPFIPYKGSFVPFGFQINLCSNLNIKDTNIYKQITLVLVYGTLGLGASLGALNLYMLFKWWSLKRRIMEIQHNSNLIK